MLFLKLFLIPIILAAPELSSNWTSPTKEQLKVEVRGGERFIRPCLYGGLEVVYRYHIQLCQRKTLWFDDCGDPQLVIHNLELDPISENYIISKDLLRDEAPPISRSVSDLAEAIVELSSIKELPVFVLRASSEPQTDQYVGVKVVADCRGEYNKNLARFASFITLGLTRSNEFDTGWVDFTLSN